MKTIPPQCPEPETVKYWKSIEQLEQAPEVRDWLEREFPAGASEAGGDFDRRGFLKLMSASLAMAGVGVLGAGCRRPEQKIYPFAKLPDDYVHGAAKYYATAMPTRTGGIPLLVKSNDGRPTKIEGNPDHPDSNGGTDVYAQASILSLYDPDRAQRFTLGGNTIAREAALDQLNAIGQRFSANGGQGLAILVERSTSPSRLRLQRAIKQKLPQANFYVYDPISSDIHREAATAFAGRAVDPYFHFERAKAILSLDCDFLGAEDATYLHCRNFARSRRIENGTMSRFYAVEPLMTQTGMNADHRLRVPASLVIAIAAGIAAQLGVPGVNAIPLPEGVNPEWIKACAADLRANGANSLVVAGFRQPLAVHLLAHAINQALGANGRTINFREAPDFSEAPMTQLAQALNAGQVDTLVVLGGNAIFTAPANLNWAATQRKAKTVVRLGYYEDESFAGSDLHIPATHYLESWGDVRTADGTVVIIQPLVQPLFDGLNELEVLARVGGLPVTDAFLITRETFGGNEEAWKQALHDGFVPNSALAPVAIQPNAGAIPQALANLQVVAPTLQNLELVFSPDYHVFDGRWANNAWLAEMPDPVTKMTWDNAVLVSRRTAEALGLANRQFIEITLDGRTVRAPIWVQPGQADFTLGLPLGFGREKGGRIANFDGKAVGFNFYPLRTTAGAGFISGAKIQPANAFYQFANTQDHWSMEGRPIIREANLEQFKKTPKFAESFDFEKPPGGNESLYPNPLDWKRDPRHQWGMAIDLNTCVGCNACVIACQSENNVPVVGKDQVRKGREMHWLRIDRYYAGNPALEPTFPEDRRRNPLRTEEEQYKEHWIDDPQVVNQPMLCQHCEYAPCENVCPVNATVHDDEGLNLMVYNRCVGTRYCSNNCPWKVRRFNYFDYTKRPLTELYKPVTTTKPTRAQDEWELLALVRNPDVTVRMRGVMEKCTFCVQRIEAAHIAQKVKAGQSGNTLIPEGAIKTACQQACPAEAIVFGNILNPESAVSKLKNDPRNYTTLDFLNTKPRLTYLARIRNPNPAMPDYYDMPMTSKAYFEKAGTHAEEGAHSPVNGEKGGAH